VLLAIAIEEHLQRKPVDCLIGESILAIARGPVLFRFLLTRQPLRTHPVGRRWLLVQQRAPVLVVTA